MYFFSFSLLFFIEFFFDFICDRKLNVNDLFILMIAFMTKSFILIVDGRYMFCHINFPLFIIPWGFCHRLRNALWPFHSSSIYSFSFPFFLARWIFLLCAQYSFLFFSFLLLLLFQFSLDVAVLLVNGLQIDRVKRKIAASILWHFLFFFHREVVNETWSNGFGRASNKCRLLLLALQLFACHRWND